MWTNEYQDTRGNIFLFESFAPVFDKGKERKLQSQSYASQQELG